MWHSCRFLTQFVVFLYFIPGIISQDTCNNDYDIRLINDTNVSANIGRVEVCLDGTWGRVCDDGWDINDATTVCTQLGHNVTGIPTRRSFYIYMPSPIAYSHLTNAQCRSNDTRLSDCDIDRTGVNNSCDQSEQAGVVCFQGDQCTKDGEVRLQNGTNDVEGRVEFCFSGFWWEVCANGWDEVDANVVCSQLGYGKSALVMNTFESRGAAVILRNVGCNSSLTELSQCVSPEEIYAVPNYRTSCGYTRAGVKCANLSDSITVTFVNGESTSETLDLSTNILPMSAILGAVVGSAALVILIIIIVVVTIIVALTRNRNTTKDNFGMKENEAYGTAQQRNVVVTQQNEAYGTAQQRNVVVTQPNEAYGTAQQRNAVLTQQNEAYGTAQQRNVVVTQQNEAYGTAQQRNDVLTQPNEAYGTLEEDYVTVV